jgi:hypothetical protein
VSLFKVDEDSYIAKEIQKLVDEVKAKCEVSDMNPASYASDTLSHTKPEFLSLFAGGERRQLK